MIGSRWVPGRLGGELAAGAARRSRVGGNLYARLLLGIPVRDVTAGYRLFRRSTLEAIDLASVESAGYIFQTDLAFRTVRARDCGWSRCRSSSSSGCGASPR